MTRRSDVRRLLTEVREQVESGDPFADLRQPVNDRKVLVGVDLEAFEGVNTDAMTQGRADAFESPQEAADALEGANPTQVRGGRLDALLGEQARDADRDAAADAAGE